jgi:hypothetical protein
MSIHSDCSEYGLKFAWQATMATNLPRRENNIVSDGFKALFKRLPQPAPIGRVDVISLPEINLGQTIRGNRFEFFAGSTIG